VLGLLSDGESFVRPERDRRGIVEPVSEESVSDLVLEDARRQALLLLPGVDPLLAELSVASRDAVRAARPRIDVDRGEIAIVIGVDVDVAAVSPVGLASEPAKEAAILAL